MTITNSSTRLVAVTLGVAAAVALALSLALAPAAHAASICPGTTFSTNLKAGASGVAVMQLQQFLNMDPDTMVASTGAGSPGNETTYFGPLTTAAVEKFQQKYAAQILTPLGLTTPTPNFYSSSRAEANAICAGSTGSTTTGTGTTSAAGTAVVAAAAQPANTLAPQGAERVPFTTFTVTANGAPVTINSVTVQRQGPSLDTDFSGVELINASTGVQVGLSRVLDSNHSATIGSPITIPAGTSMTFQVAANVAALNGSIPGSGDIGSFAVTAVNTSGAAVSGSLPITGASNTINTSLTIGTATVQQSSYDPNSAVSEPVGTTGYRFSGIRINSGSTEDETLKSITWYQAGSASGLANVMTVVNGTSYPTTLDSTGRYYTTVFPSGIVIPKGTSVDVYVQADLTGNTTSGTTAEFDIYRSTDVYLVGNTYGFGITPTGSAFGAGVTGTYPNQICTTAPSATCFLGSTTATPWFRGSAVTVTGGTFSTIQNATTVGAQNVAVNVNNEPLGGFTTNLTGEGVTAQQVKIHFTTNPAIPALQNVELVNSSGSVIAGPYNATCDAGSVALGTNCGSTAQTVTFTGSIDFPVGTQNYTVQGEVNSNTQNGATIQGYTTPSSDWTSVTGDTTGNNITISTGEFTMNTMTVQGATLVVSNGSSPTSQNVVAGGQNIQFATIQLDASQSGEDVRLSSLPVTLTITGGTPVSALNNCQVWNGSTALNTGSRVINGSSLTNASSTNITFNFDNALVVPKGTVLGLTLTCNLSSSAQQGSSFQFAANSTGSNYSVTGNTSGSTVTVANPTGSAPTMTVQTGGTSDLAASMDSSAPGYTLVSGGTTGVTVNVLRFQSTNEAVNLQKVGLQLTNTASSSPSDLTQVYLYAGNNLQTTSGTSIAAGTLLGTASFTGNNTTATSTLTQIVQIPNNSAATIVVKADLARIGTNQPGVEGHRIAIDFLNAQGVGANSGTTVSIGSTQYTGSYEGGASGTGGIRVFRAVPVVAIGPSGPTNPSGQQVVLKKFSVTASSADTSSSIGIYQIAFGISESQASTSNLQLHAYTDSGYSQPASVPGSSNGQFGGAQAYGSTIYFNQSTPLEISEGSTVYFTLTGDTTQTGSNNTGTVFATLLGDTTYPSLSGFMGTAAQVATSSKFVWSPNSTTTSATTNVDWTNGFGISGLPSTGI